MRDWENIYKNKGVVQAGVLSVVEDASKLFKKHGVKKILDLGCGTGRHLIYLAKEGFMVYGVDISKKAIELSRGNLGLEGVSCVELKQGDMKSIPYGSEFFDAVVSLWVINHALTGDIVKIVGEIKRVLKPGGLVVLKNLSVNDPNFGVHKKLEPGTFLGDEEGEEDVPHHFFTEEELRSLFSEFEILKLVEAPHFSQRANKMRTSVDLIARKK